MMRKWQTRVYQAGSSANHLLAHHRKDCGPRASWPVQGRSSAGGGSREFHLWAWLDTTVDSSADPTAAAQQSHTHSRVLLTSSQGFRRGRMRTRSPAITDIPHKASIICYLLQNQHNLWSSVLIVLTFIRSRDVHGFLNSKVPWYTAATFSTNCCVVTRFVEKVAAVYHGTKGYMVWPHGLWIKFLSPASIYKASY